MPDKEKSEQEGEPSLERLTLEYWARPTRPAFLDAVTGRDTRNPQYLDASLVKQVLKLIYPGDIYNKIRIRPDLEDSSNSLITDLFVDYSEASELYVRRVRVSLIDNEGKPWNKYRILVEGTNTSLEEAWGKILEARSNGTLKCSGFLIPNPPREDRMVQLNPYLPPGRPVLG